MAYEIRLCTFEKETICEVLSVCSKIANDVSNRVAEVQNQVNAIRDCLQIVEGNLMDFADYYYDIDCKVRL